jgi:hypothetical protein
VCSIGNTGNIPDIAHLPEVKAASCSKTELNQPSHELPGRVEKGHRRAPAQHHYCRNHFREQQRLESQGPVLEAVLGGEQGPRRGPEAVPRRTVGRELVYNDELTALQWALNSAVECHLHTLTRHVESGT